MLTTVEIIYPFNRKNINDISYVDILTFSLIQEAKTILDKKEVTVFPDGTFHCRIPVILMNLLCRHDDNFASFTNGAPRAYEDLEAGRARAIGCYTFLPFFHRRELWIQNDSGVPIGVSALAGTKNGEEYEVVIRSAYRLSKLCSSY